MENVRNKRGTDVATTAGLTIRSWPQAVTAADGARVRLQSFEGGRRSSRAKHLVWDKTAGAVDRSKARWLPRVPSTVGNAFVRLGDANGNQIYLRRYPEGFHAVVVRPGDGEIVRQAGWVGDLWTQFPKTVLGRYEDLTVLWQRPEEGNRASGHLDSPTPQKPASSVQGPRQGSATDEYASGSPRSQTPPRARYSAKQLPAGSKPLAEYTASEDKVAYGSEDEANQAIDTVADELGQGGTEADAGPVAPGDTRGEGDLRSEPALGEPYKSSVPGDLRTHRRVDYVGREIASVEELADLWQVYRHPRIEHFHIIYTKGDTIVAHNAMSSGRVEQTMAMETADLGRLRGRMGSRMRRLGADGYYLVHNHPSGDPSPSAQDAAVTARYMSAVDGFRGHLILDHDTFFLMHPEAGATEDEVQLTGRDMVLPHPSSPSTVAETPAVKSPESLAAIGAEALRAWPSALLFLDAKLRVVAWEPVPQGTRPGQYIHQRLKQYGAATAMVVTDNSDSFAAWNQALAADPHEKRYRHVQEILHVQDGAPHQSARALGAIEAPPPPPRGRTASSFLWEDQAEYKAAGRVEALVRKVWSENPDEGIRYWLRRYLKWGEGVAGRLPAVNRRENRRRGTMEADTHALHRRMKALKTAVRVVEHRIKQGQLPAAERAQLDAMLFGTVPLEEAVRPTDPAAAAAFDAVAADAEFGPRQAAAQTLVDNGAKRPVIFNHEDPW